MKPALNLGERQISSDRILQRLGESQLFPQLLREIAIDEVIEQTETASPQDFTYTPEEFDRLYQQITQISPFQGMNSTQLAAITIRTLKLQKFKQMGWAHKVSAYFDEQKSGLDRVVLSMLLVKDGELAQELFFRIAGREQSFGEVAIAYPEATQAPTGGVMGPIFLRDLAPAIGQMVRQLQPGQLSSLFQIDGSYGFIRLDEFHPAQLDDGMHQFLIDELFEVWIQSHIALEVGLDRQTATNFPLALPAPIFSIEPDPKLAVPEIDLTLDADCQSDITPTFPPEFAEKETILVVDSNDDDEPTGSASTPEVTVVREPDLADIEISTSFFFPDPQQHPALKSASSQKKDSEPPESHSHSAFFSPPTDRGDDRAQNSSFGDSSANFKVGNLNHLAQAQYQLRLQKLGIAAMLLLLIVIGGIGLDRIASPGNISRHFPEFFKRID